MFYSIQHTTRFAYDSPVSETVMEVRKHPRGELNQRCLSFALEISPKARVFSYRDYLGNLVHHFNVPGRFSGLTVTAHSLVEVQPPATPAMLTSDAWAELDAIVSQGDYWEFLNASQYARPSQSLLELKRELGIERGYDPLTTVLNIHEKIYSHFGYEPASTTVDSPIDEALSKRKGVCQDFAHIMIALVRALKIPCRYVSGYLFHSVKHRSTEGATHAWVEALIPHSGWVGFDPTNRVLASERHVRTGVGRDYADVPPTRGVFKGTASSALAVSVRVEVSDRPQGEPLREPPAEEWVQRADPATPASPAQEQQQQQQQ